MTGLRGNIDEGHQCVTGTETMLPYVIGVLVLHVLSYASRLRSGSMLPFIYLSYKSHVCPGPSNVDSR